MGITAGGMIILLAISGGLPEIMWLGDEGFYGSAEAAGMGNTWYADESPQGSLENPVMTSRLPEGFTAGITGTLVLDMEKRTRRVYDSFGGVVGESEDGFNQSFAPLPGGAAVAWSDGTFGVSGGYRAVGTFQYDFSKVMNDDNYVKVADQILDIGGVLGDFSISGSWNSGGILSVGAGGGLISGTRNIEYIVEYVDPIAEDIEQTVETDISGMVFRGSAGAHLGRIDITAGLEQITGLTTETSGSEIDGVISTDVTMPFKVMTGAVYRPGNRLMSCFTADLWWSPTSQVEIDDLDPGYRNSWGFGAGVENTLPGEMIARAGFEYDCSPVASALDRMGFTAGLGWVHDDLSVDAAIGFSPVRWDQYQVDGLMTFTAGDSLVVESSRTAFSLGVTQSF